MKFHFLVLVMLFNPGVNGPMLAPIGVQGWIFFGGCVKLAEILEFGCYFLTKWVFRFSEINSYGRPLGSAETNCFRYGFCCVFQSVDPF